MWYDLCMERENVVSILSHVERIETTIANYGAQAGCFI